MPKRFAIKLPDVNQRRSILSLVHSLALRCWHRASSHPQMLRDIILEPKFDLEALVRRTEGLSGSDLKEACRNAAMVPVREVMRLKEGQGPAALERAKTEVRGAQRTLAGQPS
jgi:SpoVK/Ycf46/Vps4 family AAA+-type ATPase